MKRNIILENLTQIVKEAIDDEDVVIDENTTASDVEGWDSLAQVIIMGEIQQRFSVKFTAAEFNTIGNVGSLIDAIITKIE